MNMLKNTEYSQAGDEECKVVFVFSCPGRYEEEYGPVNGRTGDNLNLALSKLMALDKNKKYFLWNCKCHYHVTNACTSVEYIKKTERTQPTKHDVLSQDNLNRLSNELQGMELIIACGERAQWAVNSLQSQKKIQATVIKVLHLSPRAINSWKLMKGQSLDKKIEAWVNIISHNIPEEKQK